MGIGSSVVSGLPSRAHRQSELVAITSQTCPHCTSLQPVLDQAAKRVTVRQVDTATATATPAGRDLLSSIGYSGYVPYITYVRYTPEGGVIPYKPFTGKPDLHSILKYAEMTRK